MTKLRDFDHNYSLDPAVVVKRAFLLKLEANPPNCLSQKDRENVEELLDSQIPLHPNWVKYTGKACT